MNYGPADCLMPWTPAEVLDALLFFRTHYAGLIRKRCSAGDDRRG